MEQNVSSVSNPPFNIKISSILGDELPLSSLATCIENLHEFFTPSIVHNELPTIRLNALMQRFSLSTGPFSRSEVLESQVTLDLSSDDTIRSLRSASKKSAPMGHVQLDNVCSTSLVISDSTGSSSSQRPETRNTRLNTRERLSQDNSLEMGTSLSSTVEVSEEDTHRLRGLLAMAGATNESIIQDHEDTIDCIDETLIEHLPAFLTYSREVHAVTAIELSSPTNQQWLEDTAEAILLN